MVDINAPGRPAPPPSREGDINRWLLPMMLTALLALGGWIGREVVDHNASLAKIEGTLGDFNEILRNVAPHLSKIDLDLQHEKDVGDQQELHLESHDKAIDMLRNAIYSPAHRPGQP